MGFSSKSGVERNVVYPFLSFIMDERSGSLTPQSCCWQVCHMDGLSHGWGPEKVPTVVKWLLQPWWESGNWSCPLSSPLRRPFHFQFSGDCRRSPRVNRAIFSLGGFSSLCSGLCPVSTVWVCAGGVESTG